MRLGIHLSVLELLDGECLGLLRVVLSLRILLLAQRSPRHPRECFQIFGRHTPLCLVGIQLRFGCREIIVRQLHPYIVNDSRERRRAQRENHETSK